MKLIENFAQFAKVNVWVDEKQIRGPDPVMQLRIIVNKSIDRVLFSLSPLWDIIT